MSTDIPILALEYYVGAARKHFDESIVCQVFVSKDKRCLKKPSRTSEFYLQRHLAKKHKMFPKTTTSTLLSIVFKELNSYSNEKEAS